MARRFEWLCLTVLGACNAARPPAPVPAPAEELRFDPAAIDRRVDPCHDFYDFACGGWRASHPVPADRSRWSRYAELEAVNLDRERAIVDAAIAGSARTGASAAERRVGAYAAACLDQAAIDRGGIAPIRPLLAAIDAIRQPADLGDVLAELHRSVAPLGFALYAEPDARDAHRTIAAIEPGELGLGEPEDYTRDDAGPLRAQYRDHVERVLRLLGDGDPAADAARVVALETTLARALPDAAARRDREAQIHPMTLDALAGHLAIDWRRYVTRLGAAGLAGVNVAFVGWLDALGGQLTPDGLAGVRAYLRFHVARALATVLPRSIDEAFFAFDHLQRGIQAQPPRWKRCLALVDRDLGDEVGRLFVARWFPAASRARATQIVARIVDALRAELASNDWLAPAARASAMTKLANIRFTIGYSDRWKRYDGLAVHADDPVGNARRAAGLAADRELAKLGHPPDRDEFFALPQQLEGSSAESLVSVEFTAGFLQPPVFDPRLDDPINFGGFGGVIGHEITHQFDDEGRKFDVDGNLAPWWTPDDVAHYQARAQCFVDEYSQFHIEDGSPVDGRLTLGENLADNGGLRLAWNALRPTAGAPAGETIDGFTPAQRFFLAWAQIRCENTTPEAARRQVHSDEHSPGRWRVNGVVRNMPELAAAFACPAGAPMAPETRCRLW
jgi:putative endopeptidase